MTAGSRRLLESIVLSLFSIVRAYAQGDPLILHASGASVGIPPDAVLQGHAISMSKNGDKVVQSGPAPPAAVADAMAAVRPTLSAQAFGALDTLSVPRKLLQVNAPLDAMLGSDSSPDKAYRVSWAAAVDGIRIVTHGDIGACSTIPTYVEYFVTLTYKITVAVDSGTTKILDLAVADPEGVLVHSRCWTLGGKGQLQRHDIDNGALAKALSERTQAVSVAMTTWLEKNKSEFLDDVLDNLTVPKDPAGLPSFNGSSKSWASDVANQPNLVWSFTSDPRLQAWMPASK